MRLGRNPANPLCEGLGLPDSLAAADGLVEDFGVARPGVGHRPHEGVVRESTQGRAGRGPYWPPPRPVNMGELLPIGSFVCLGRCSRGVNALLVLPIGSSVRLSGLSRLLCLTASTLGGEPWGTG